MARFYLMTQPLKMTMTGHIHLTQHIPKHFPELTYTSLAVDGYTDFGLLEGSGDLLSYALTFCSKSFNVERIFEDEFVGAVCLFKEDETMEDPETGEEVVTKTVTQLLDEFSISYTSDSTGKVDKVYHAKKFKYKEFKQIAKNEFTDYNDLIANLSKTLLLLEEYRSSLTSEQQTRLDNCITNMKSIYDTETCLTALENDIALIGSIIPDYYTAKQNVASKTTLDEVRNAVYR